MGKIKEVAIERRYTNRTSDELYIYSVSLVGVDEEKLNGETVFRVYKTVVIPIDMVNDAEFRQGVEDIRAWVSENRKLYEKLVELATNYGIPIKLILTEDC
jgi:imidazole glycerol phosphate synthase subunit HisF